jgi:hypothetical protein
MRGAKKDEKRKPLLYDTMAEGERVSEKCRHHPRGKKIASTIFGTFAKKHESSERRASRRVD